MNETIHLVEGERVFPCRCGVTHAGDYGLYDWMHHNCFHGSELVRLVPEDDPDYLMCMDCGETFRVEPLDESLAREKRTFAEARAEAVRRGLLPDVSA